MSLQEPTVKMSKSDPNEMNYLTLLDDPDTIAKKIRKAVMDSMLGISYEPETRPGVANLLSIYAALTDETPQAVAARFADKGNAALKNELTELLIASLAPIRQRYQELRADAGYLDTVLRRGAEQARDRSAPTLAATYRAMGFVTYD